MPTEPGALRQELERRSLAMVGAFVPVELKNPDAHARGEAHALKVARLLAGVMDSGSGKPTPLVILADDNGTDPVRTQHAGHVIPQMGLSAAEWDTFARGAERIARAVRRETGLQMAFHHHCAGYVETPEEIARFLDMTDPDLLGLVFDTGHFLYGTGSNDGLRVEDGLKRFGERIQHVHFKDCQPQIAEQARTEGWTYSMAEPHGGVFGLGMGGGPFDAVPRWFPRRGCHAWVPVEQGVLPCVVRPHFCAQRI